MKAMLGRQGKALSPIYLAAALAALNSGIRASFNCPEDVTTSFWKYLKFINNLRYK